MHEGNNKTHPAFPVSKLTCTWLGNWICTSLKFRSKDLGPLVTRESQCALYPLWGCKHTIPVLFGFVQSMPRVANNTNLLGGYRGGTTWGLTTLRSHRPDCVDPRKIFGFAFVSTRDGDVPIEVISWRALVALIFRSQKRNGSVTFLHNWTNHMSNIVPRADFSWFFFIGKRPRSLNWPLLKLVFSMSLDCQSLL